MPIGMFSEEDQSIHRIAVASILGPDKSERELRQGRYAYLVKGGSSGYLDYKRPGTDHWVSIANWGFYGSYMAVRYRKPIWLRPMYHYLFSNMNYTITSFDQYSIRLLGTNGEILSSRIFRLSPPGAVMSVLKEKFNFGEEQISELQRELNL
jgi:hypothetical protein